MLLRKLYLWSAWLVADAFAKFYGLMGMAQLVIAFISLFQDLGTSSAVIQRPDVNQRFLSTIWWLNLSISVFLTGVCWLLSPLAARLSCEPRSVCKSWDSRIRSRGWLLCADRASAFVAFS